MGPADRRRQELSKLSRGLFRWAGSLTRRGFAVSTFSARGDALGGGTSLPLCDGGISVIPSLCGKSA